MHAIFQKKKQKRYIKRMIYLLSLYRNNINSGFGEEPEELAKVFFIYMRQLR